jgi:hypothetical protein
MSQQEFLKIPLLKKNTKKQLDQIKEAINQIANVFGITVEYVADRKNGWFKATAIGDQIAILKFLLTFAAMQKED